jgi:hypothetical protein
LSKPAQFFSLNEISEMRITAVVAATKVEGRDVPLGVILR